MTDWADIEYLKSGNGRQRKAYLVLKETKIFSLLEDFDPVLVGTVPIGIDIPDSDLDIICYAPDLSGFRAVVRNCFSAYRSFSENNKDDVYVASFDCEGFTIEIFAQPTPVRSQLGYRHMVIEDRLLQLSGTKFREDVVALKLQGYKTEPAFGLLLKIDNPYSGLLDLEDLPDRELMRYLKDKGYRRII